MSSSQTNLCFSTLPNLADPRLGASVIYATDEFFGEKNRLIDPLEPVFIEGKYDSHGKWMDGWETRRKRSEGNDYCVIKLGRSIIPQEIVVDTSHFTGNYPAAISIDSCYDLATPDDLIYSNDEILWSEVIPASSVEGDSIQRFSISSSDKITHLRLNIYPDGGVARLRVYGLIAVDQNSLDQSIDLLALENGSRAIASNNEHYGSIKNITMPGKGVNMGDGWETRRRREPGNDWAIFQLACPGLIESIEVDTSHFKGNYPESCSIQAALVPHGTDQSLVTQSMFWQELLPQQALSMDAVHRFTEEVLHDHTVSHIRFNSFPDGGISRLRLFGKRSAAE